MKIISTLDCGCAIRADGSRAWCPSCLEPGHKQTQISFADLSRANLARVTKFKNRHGEIAHPTGLDHWSMSDWCLAAFGELGEAANLIKKMNRNELVSRVDLAHELADTVIYLDLLAQRAGINLGDAVRIKFNLKSEQVGADIFL